MGALAVICTSVVAGPTPGRVDMAKVLLLALEVAGVLMAESGSWSGA